MNTDYKLFPSSNNVETLSLHWQKEIQSRGFYTGIHFEPELNMIFRSYSRGNDESYDGLQIYRNETLLADVDVPAGFKVSGYAAPYIYSSIFVNEENEQLYVYRFVIDDLL
ncbi:MAG: hypothetical protein ACFCU6_14310 [Balneolaceae bacterium]